MYVVDPDHGLAGQGLCFICEKAIDHPKEKAIRTGHEFDPLFHTPLAGDKYVCQGCAETLALTLGFISPGEAEVLKETAQFAELRFRQLQELAAGLSGSLPVTDVSGSVPVGAVTATKKEKVSGSKA